MKTRLVTVICALAISWAGVTPSYALSDGSPEAIAADVLVGRPACFVATVVGSAIFVVALPFAAMSKSTKKTAEALVTKPAKATFTRPLGEFEELRW
jgi:hypothetical protein